MSIGMLILALSIIPAMWKRSGYFVGMWILASAFLAFEYMEVLYSRNLPEFIVTMPYPVGIINISLNKLSAFFGVIFSIGLPPAMFYGHYYLKEHPTSALRSHLFWLGIMGISMHTLLWIRHSMVFLLVWELMSLSSFFCVLYSKKENLKPALNYIVTMQAGAAFLIAGFALAFLQSGTFDFSGFEDMAPLSMYLILIGFAFKAGIFPFASWLPQAHPVAPAHVSGIMSAMLIKTGFYGILMIASMNRFSLREIGVFSLIFVVSAFWAVSHLLYERNLKRALAFSSVENVGIAGMGFCAGLLGMHANLPNMAVLGFTGAFLHLFFHSLFKAQLFYNSGNILLASGTLNIDKMGALARRMPVSASMTLIGIMAISALPLTNGFLSELSIFRACIEASDAALVTHLLVALVLMAALAFIGALAMISFFRIFAVVFLGAPRSDDASNAREQRLGCRMPVYVLSFAILLSGIFPNISLRFVKPLIRWFDLDMLYFSRLQALSSKISLVYALLIGIFLFVFLLRKLLVNEKSGATWACAFPLVNSRMQSSSITYIQPLSYFLKPFMCIRVRHENADSDFAQKVEYSEQSVDALWEKLVVPSSRLISRFLALFSGIHNGRTNSYITWMMVFLVSLIVWVVLQ
jgi:formate hydrogenlyase subunit 3/multisubunit Na+/H+ antiporter MnhD subunit